MPAAPADLVQAHRRLREWDGLTPAELAALDGLAVDIMCTDPGFSLAFAAGRRSRLRGWALSDRGALVGAGCLLPGVLGLRLSWWFAPLVIVGVIPSALAVLTELGRRRSPHRATLR